MLIDQIKADQLQARKDRDTVRASLLTTLYSEAAMIGKNDGNRATTDQEVIAVIKKFIKGIDETVAAGAQTAPQLLVEKEILTAYLPSQLDDAALSVIIDGIIESQGISGMKQMGLVMKELNANYAGQFDGKAASTIVRGKLG